MKTRIGLLGIIAVLTIFLASCNKKDASPVDTVREITGTYKGTLSTTETLKSLNGDLSATTDIIAAGEDLIEVHCYSEGFDTTIMLNIYEDHDTVMVCMTDGDFEEEYGHMNGHMEHEMHTGGTDWEHHLDEEHKPGDRHYGMFDMKEHTFEYSFKMMQGDSVYYKTFKGTKVTDR